MNIHIAFQALTETLLVKTGDLSSAVLSVYIDSCKKLPVRQFFLFCLIYITNKDTCLKIRLNFRVSLNVFYQYVT